MVRNDQANLQPTLNKGKRGGDVSFTFLSDCGYLLFPIPPFDISCVILKTKSESYAANELAKSSETSINWKPLARGKVSALWRCMFYRDST